MRRVLITGGSRGIGAACTERFCAAGDRVWFLYRSNHAAARQVALKTGAVPVPCDVASREQTESAIGKILAECGGIDVLVNNAGISQFKLFQDITEDEWDRMMQVHLGGAFRCIQGVLPGMIARKQGRIINIASMWGQVGAACETHYSAAKAGLIGLTKALAQEVGPSGIRVNCVSPGVIETDMNASLTPDGIEALKEQTPLCRLGTAAEVAEAVFWLSSDASSFLTGQILAPNGGFVI